MRKLKYFNKLNKILDNQDNILFEKKIKKYIKNGFNVNEINEYGNTLLHISMRKRNYDIIKLLIDNYDANLIIKNNDGRTPLHIATIYCCNCSMFYIFNEDTNNKIESSKKIISEIIKKYDKLMLIKDNFNKTAMDYYVLHSEINENVKSKYKIRNKFFELLQSKDPNNYDMSMSIFLSLNK